MKRSRPWSILLGTCLLLPAAARSQTTEPATEPASQPTSQPAREPKLETTPPGFIRVDAGQYRAFCLPVDEPWVKQTLANFKIDQQPSTRPSDILAKIAQNRQAVAAGLGEDLGIEPGPIVKAFDEELAPALQKIDQMHPPVVFLVTTEQKLVALINADWKHPRISYNRLMDQIKFDDRVFLSPDAPNDESLMLANYDPTDSVDARMKKLRDAAEKFGSDSAFLLAAKARAITQQSIKAVVDKQAFATLKLPDNESWLQFGVGDYLAAKYAPQFIGSDPKQTMADLTYERPDADPKAAAVDMLNLPDLSQYLPQYRGPWIAAAHRKAAGAIETLVAKAGPNAIRKAITAVRKNSPKDPASMVALIAGATDVDLTDDLRPKK